MKSSAGETIVLGMGKSGLSCARYLQGLGQHFSLMDTRSEPENLAVVQQEFSGIEIMTGGLDAGRLAASDMIVLSPGIAADHEALSQAREQQVDIVNDIELFARHVHAPVVAITGSNGKSTVTALLGEMAAHAGIDVGVGGNIGTPALELLERDYNLYVLELSSFQLELTHSLNTLAAVVLNISEDHLDRHRDMQNYAAIKQRVYRGNGVMVVNLDDSMVKAMVETGRQVIGFTLATPANKHEFGVMQLEGKSYLARGDKPLMATDEMSLQGRHNHANALAALALGEVAGIPMASMCETLRSFAGLAHRCAYIGEYREVKWFEDSKGTNVGATMAALAGLEADKVILIAGGQGKGQDFSVLHDLVQQRCRAVLLYGEDASALEQALKGGCPLYPVADLKQAAHKAAQLAEPGDAVLFSPACASFDMFSNYVERGEAFVQAAREVMQ